MKRSAVTKIASFSSHWIPKSIDSCHRCRRNSAGKTVSSLDSGVDGRGQFSVLFSHPEETFQIRILTPKNVANPVISVKLPCVDSVFLSVSEKTENGTVSATVSTKEGNGGCSYTVGNRGNCNVVAHASSLDTKTLLIPAGNSM